MLNNHALALMILRSHYCGRWTGLKFCFHVMIKARDPGHYLCYCCSALATAMLFRSFVNISQVYALCRKFELLATFTTATQYSLKHGEDPELTKHEFVRLFRSCGNSRDLCRGKKLYEEAQRKGIVSDPLVVSSILSMYCKCGKITHAELVFGASFHRNIILWNSMLSAYVKNGLGQEALLLYRQLILEALNPNVLTFVVAIQACANFSSTEKASLVKGRLTKLQASEIAQGLHSDVLRMGYVSDVRVATTLVSMYSKCGLISQAEHVFSGMLDKNVVSWNAMLSTYVENRKGESALLLYAQMEVECVEVDDLTILFAVQGCSILAELQGIVLDACLEIIQTLHMRSQKMGFTKNVLLGTTLVNVYGKCGSVLDAEKVFCMLPQRTIVSWNAMLTIYVELGLSETTLLLYRQMQEENVKPDHHTLTIILQACGNLVVKKKPLAGENSILVDIAQALHARVRRMGFLL